MAIHFSNIRRSLCLGLVSFLTAVSALVAVAPNTALADPFTYTDISAGYHSSCSLSADGRALCWGWNYQGYLGVGSRETSVTVPSVVTTPAGVRFVSIEAGSYFTTCGLTTTGAVYCWGESALGRWTGAPSITPVLVDLPSGVVATQLSVGATHACVISNDGVYCWGNWSTGELGVGEIEPTVTPVHVTLPNNQTAVSIAAGVAFTCVATTIGSAYCWGTNTDGQTGIGYKSNQHSPIMVPTAVVVPDGINFVQVTTGLNRACAVDACLVLGPQLQRNIWQWDIHQQLFATARATSSRNFVVKHFNWLVSHMWLDNNRDIVVLGHQRQWRTRHRHNAGWQDNSPDSVARRSRCHQHQCRTRPNLHAHNNPRSMVLGS